jgi:hypothetical protein
VGEKTHLEQLASSKSEAREDTPFWDCLSLGVHHGWRCLGSSVITKSKGKTTKGTPTARESVKFEVSRLRVCGPARWLSLLH